MKYFVRWYDEEDYTEVSENFMNAYNERYYSELPAMILMFDGKAGDEMYFTRIYTDNEGKVELMK